MFFTRSSSKSKSVEQNEVKCFPELILVQNDDMERLFDHLMSKYNKNVRPVSDDDDLVTVKLGLKLIQIVDVVRNIDWSHLCISANTFHLLKHQDEKNQMMQTHVYVIHVRCSMWQNLLFFNFILFRNGTIRNFDGHQRISVESSLFFCPATPFGNRILSFITVSYEANLKNSLKSSCWFIDADGDYHISSKSKARIFHDGTVIWVMRYRWSKLRLFRFFCFVLDATDDL